MLRSAGLHPPRLTTTWTLDSGDCATAVSISDSASVGVYGYFSGWHAAWNADGCLSTSDTHAFDRKGDRYYAAGHALIPGTYYTQVEYCHDSDFSGPYGNWYCRASNVLSFRIPSAVAGTLSHVTGNVFVNGKRARDPTTLHYGDKVRTGGAAGATIDLSRAGELGLRHDSKLIPTGPAAARLLSGKVRAHLDRSFRISSPNAGAVARRATLELVVTSSTTRERTYRGSAAFSNTTGSTRTVVVNAGYESRIHGSNPPTAPKPF